MDCAVDCFRVGQSCAQSHSPCSHPTPGFRVKFRIAWIINEGSGLGGKAGDEQGTWSTDMISVRWCPDLGAALSSCSTTRNDCALNVEPALLLSHQKPHPFKCKPELMVQLSYPLRHPQTAGSERCHITLLCETCSVLMLCISPDI